jgi:hypothetical protein
MELKNVSFEFPPSKIIPVYIRNRIYADGKYKQDGKAARKECWIIAKYPDFSKKFKHFLRILKIVIPTLFEYWTTEDLENLLKKSEALARER